MIWDFEKRMEAKLEKFQEVFTQDLEELKNNNNNKKKNRGEQDTRRNQYQNKLEEVEEQISDPEEIKVEINATKQNIGKRMKRNEDNLTDLWNNIKCTNIHIIGIPE